MELRCDGLTLRDMTEADIEDDIRWNTEETRWMFWDSPWQPPGQPFDAADYRRKQLESLAAPKDALRVRTALELDYQGRHIGVVSAYRTNEVFSFDPEGNHWCIGIILYEPNCWGKGIGTAAYRLYISYLFSKGLGELHTQTWSGNARMIRMARRLGFRERHRDVNTVKAEGQRYDNVTFRLTAEDWQGLPTAGGLTFKLMTPDDLDTACALDREISSSNPWPREFFSESVPDPDGYYYLVYTGGQPVGYGCMYHNHRDCDPPHYCKIVNLGVLPTYRRRGIGRATLKMLLAKAEALGASLVKLEVHTESFAVQLYRELGFEAEETVEGYYGEAGDAFVMWRRERL